MKIDFSTYRGFAMINTHNIAVAWAVITVVSAIMVPSRGSLNNNYNNNEKNNNNYNNNNNTSSDSDYNNIIYVKLRVELKNFRTHNTLY